MPDDKTESATANAATAAQKADAPKTEPEKKPAAQTLTLLNPVKWKGKRREPGAVLRGVPSEVADGLIADGDATVTKPAGKKSNDD